MAETSYNKELLLSDTSVPDVFLVQYLNILSREAIVVYLLFLLEKKNSYSIEDISRISCLPRADLDKAISELVTNDLIILKDSGEYVVTDLKQKEVDEYIKLRASRGYSLDGTELQSEERLRNSLSGSISKTFYQGRMPQIFYRLIDRCLYEYHFDSAVVYSLFENGCERKCHLKINVMENIARDWYNRGYTTADKLKEYYEKNKLVEEMKKKIGKLTRRRLNDLDITRIERWVYSMGITPDFAEYAFKCNEYRGNITLQHVEDKLSEWYDAGINSIDAASLYENERKQENRSKSARGRGRSNTLKNAKEARKAWDESEAAASTAGGKKPSGNEKAAAPEDDVEDDPILSMFGGSDEND